VTCRSPSSIARRNHRHQGSKRSDDSSIKTTKSCTKHYNHLLPFLHVTEDHHLIRRYQILPNRLNKRETTITIIEYHYRHLMMRDYQRHIVLLDKVYIYQIIIITIVMIIILIVIIIPFYFKVMIIRTHIHTHIYINLLFYSSINKHCARVCVLYILPCIINSNFKDMYI
jgi:hypothetical protein